jgi:hypothetical protein
MDIVRIVFEIVAAGGLLILGLDKLADFKYKDALKKILIAAKDKKVTEEEFQGIVDELKRVIWGDAPVPTDDDAN